jgi:hypothetical protein
MENRSQSEAPCRKNFSVPTAPTVAVPGRAPNWSHDPVPPEPPLGFEVDEVPQMLTVEHR